MKIFKDGIHEVWWGTDREGEYGDHFFLKEKDAREWERSYYKFSVVLVDILVKGDSFYILRSATSFKVSDLTWIERRDKEAKEAESLKKGALAKLTEAERKALGH